MALDIGLQAHTIDRRAAGIDHVVDDTVHDAAADEGILGKRGGQQGQFNGSAQAFDTVAVEGGDRIATQCVAVTEVLIRGAIQRRGVDRDGAAVQVEVVASHRGAVMAPTEGRIATIDLADLKGGDRQQFHIEVGRGGRRRFIAGGIHRRRRIDGGIHIRCGIEVTQDGLVIGDDVGLNRR
ncbi:MAG: hypothetical protein AB2784_24145 [Candidatus Thiodiazotropha endolucinida]